MKKQFSEVAIRRVSSNLNSNSLKKSVSEMLEVFGGINAFVSEGKEVLLKPNICSVYNQDSGRVTSPKLTKAVGDLCLEAGVLKVIVAESSMIGTDTFEAFKEAGYEQFSKMDGYELIDLKQDEVITKKTGDDSKLGNIGVFKKAYEADVIINLPKLKTIISTPISVSMKNLKGLIRDNDKRKCHHVDLNDAIVEINKIIKPALNIVDGMVGCSLYEPMQHNIILAATDAVALDASAAICMGINPDEVKYLKKANEVGLGTMDKSQIYYPDLKPEEVRISYRRGATDKESFAEYSKNVNVSSTGACSGCVAVTEALLQEGTKRGIFDKGCGIGLRIGNGPHMNNSDKIKLNLGNCAINCEGADHSVKGCPYLVNEVIKYFEK